MIETTQIVQVVLVLGLTLLATLVVVLARREADSERKAARAEAQEVREEARRMLAEAERREERIALREREVQQDVRTASAYTREIDQRIAVIARDEKRLIAERAKLKDDKVDALAAIAKLKPAAAKKQLLAELVDVAESEAEAKLRKMEKAVSDTADERARAILVTAMQRLASETASQHGVTWMSLPNEEMKGRIIGREGRNIRAFEAVTGVNLLVEEGVNAVMISSHDAARRDIAEATLAALVADGRIQPHRIEAEYKRAAEAQPKRNREAALDAADRAGVTGLRHDTIDTLAALNLRTSLGQPVLEHSVEAAQVAGAVAAELGADEDLARRAAFLHDIGKTFTGTRKGTHAAVGAAFLKENGESEKVVNAVAAHHNEVEPASLEAFIVQVADAVSASRPGARRDEAEDYVTRLEELESSLQKIAGVETVHALAAGRDIRVAVNPGTITDEEIPALARKIAKRVSDDPSVAGEVKVTVIRETRADAVAG